jgi:hypothetical protein
MAFNGSLLKFSGDNFPLKYVFKESYKVTPNRRQDLDPYRNANGKLIRNTLSHKPTTISFATVPMWNTDMAKFMKLIRDSYTVSKERKLYVNYFSPDTNGYDSGWFYVPDVEYEIDLVNERTDRLLYYPTTIEFIEY